MLYKTLKIVVRLAMLIFCRRISINDRSLLKLEGPLLLASNHPNSFLDAVLLGILFEKPIWSLARGDAFNNKWISKILSSLKIFAVYRASEGVENLSSNYATFDNCKSVFRRNGIVLIFSEGKCINEWKLRSLKKGTARLAISSWEQDIPLKVLPVGINYSSFRRFGKNVFINFGTTIAKEDIPIEAADGLRNQVFNAKLQSELQRLVFDIDKSDKNKQQELLEKKPPRLTHIILALPAALGWLSHIPLYIPVRRITHLKTADNDHYDSAMATVLLFTYPFYLLAIALISFYITKSYLSFLLLLLLPLTAWSYVQVKQQLDS